MIRPDYRNFQSPNELYHYGIPRRSGRYPWGSGKRPHQSLEKNAPEIKNYKGKAYFLSPEDLDGKTLEPRVPNNFFTKNGYEDGETKRICFAPSIDKCLLALTRKFPGETLYVYEPEKINKIYKPNEKAVPDSSITDELWIKEPTKIKKVQTIKVVKDSGKDGLKFKYGDKEAELYEWDYEFMDKKKEKIKHSSESEVKFKMNDFYYLSHGGPGSGRYPLGSGERPYQKFEGTGKSAKGIRGYIQSRRAKKAEEKEQKVRNKELAKLMEEAQAKRKHEADKEEILKKGTATDVMRYQGELSNQELRAAAERIRLENELSSYSAKEMKTAMEKVDDIMKTVRTGTEWAKIGMDTYNTFASIYNATPNGRQKPLTLVRK